MPLWSALSQALPGNGRCVAGIKQGLGRQQAADMVGTERGSYGFTIGIGMTPSLRKTALTQGEGEEFT